MAKTRIESETEVRAYIQNLKYAIQNGARINFQIQRRIDEKRNERFTNQYTVTALFPNEDPVEALKRELMTLTVEEYMQTVSDVRFPRRSEMRELLLQICFRIEKTGRCLHENGSHSEREASMYLLYGSA